MRSYLPEQFEFEDTLHNQPFIKINRPLVVAEWNYSAFAGTAAFSDWFVSSSTHRYNDENEAAAQKKLLGRTHIDETHPVESISRPWRFNKGIIYPRFIADKGLSKYKYLFKLRDYQGELTSIFWQASYYGGVLRLVNRDKDGNIIDLGLTKGNKVFLSNIKLDILDMAGNTMDAAPNIATNEPITSTIVENDVSDWYKFNVGKTTSTVEVHMYDAPYEFTYEILVPVSAKEIAEDSGSGTYRTVPFLGNSDESIKTTVVKNESSVFSGLPEMSQPDVWYIRFYKKGLDMVAHPSDSRYTFRVNLDSDGQENISELNTDVYQIAVAKAIGGERMVTGINGHDINVEHGLSQSSGIQGMKGKSVAETLEILLEEEFKAVNVSNKTRVLVTGTLHMQHNRRYYTSSKYLADSYWSSPNISGPMTWEDLQREMPEPPESKIDDEDERNKYRVDAIRKTLVGPSGNKRKAIVLYLHKQRVKFPTSSKLKPEYIFVKNSKTRRLRTGFYKIVNASGSSDDVLIERATMGSKKQQKKYKGDVAIKDNVITAKVAYESKAGDDFIWLIGEKKETNDGEKVDDETEDNKEAKKKAKEAEEADSKDINKKEPEEADADEESESDDKEKEKETDAQPISTKNKLKKIFDQNGEILVENNSPFQEDTFVVSAQEKEYSYIEKKEVKRENGKTKITGVQKTGKAFRVKLNKKLRLNLYEGETVSFFVETLTVEWAAAINDSYYDQATNKKARKPKTPPHSRPIDIPDTYFELATIVNDINELQPALDRVADWGDGKIFIKSGEYPLKRPLGIYGNTGIIAAQGAKIYPHRDFKGKWLVKIADYDEVESERIKRKFLATGKSGENVIHISRESNDSRFTKLHEIGEGWKVNARIGKRRVLNNVRIKGAVKYDSKGANVTLNKSVKSEKGEKLKFTVEFIKTEKERKKEETSNVSIIGGQWGIPGNVKVPHLDKKLNKFGIVKFRKIPEWWLDKYLDAIDKADDDIDRMPAPYDMVDIEFENDPLDNTPLEQIVKELEDEEFQAAVFDSKEKYDFMARKVDEALTNPESPNALSDMLAGNWGELSSFDLVGFAANGQKLAVPFTDVYSEWDLKFIREITAELKHVEKKRRKGLFETRWGELKKRGVKRLKLSRNDFNVFKIEDVERVEIKEAKIRPRAGYGVFIEDSDNIAITSCLIENIDDDMSYFTPKAGVRLAGKTNDIRVNKNTIKKFRCGVGDRGGGTHKNIRIANNTINNCIYGISIKKTKYLVIVGNSINWNQGGPNAILDPYYICGINVGSGAFGQDSEMQSARFGIIKNNNITGIPNFPYLFNEDWSRQSDYSKYPIYKFWIDTRNYNGVAKPIVGAYLDMCIIKGADIDYHRNRHTFWNCADDDSDRTFIDASTPTVIYYKDAVGITSWSVNGNNITVNCDKDLTDKIRNGTFRSGAVAMVPNVTLALSEPLAINEVWSPVESLDELLARPERPSVTFSGGDDVSDTPINENQLLEEDSKMYIVDTKNINKMCLKVSNHYGVPDEYVFEALIDRGNGLYQWTPIFGYGNDAARIKSLIPEFLIINLNNPNHVQINDNVVEVRVFLDWMNDGKWLNASNDIMNERYGLIQDPYNQRIDIEDISEKVGGYRMRIESIDSVHTPAEIIEMSGSLMMNLTDMVESVSIKNELGDPGHINPVGTPSANDGSVTFVNDLSILSDLNDQILPLEENVIFHIWYRYGIINNSYKERLDVRSRDPLTNGPSEWTFMNQNIYNPTLELWPFVPKRVKIATMLSNEWRIGGNADASVNLLDFARILQTRSAQDTFIHNQRVSKKGIASAGGMKVTNVIAQLLDSVNFGNYIIYDTPQLKDMETMTYAWSKNEETVWEVISDIAKTYQMALFFDQNGKLHVMSRAYLYDADSRGTDYYVQVGSDTYSQKISSFKAFQQEPTKIDAQIAEDANAIFMSTLDFTPGKSIHFDTSGQNSPFRSDYSTWFWKYKKENSSDLRFSGEFKSDFYRNIISPYFVQQIMFFNFQYFLPNWKPKYQKYVRQFTRFSEVFDMQSTRTSGVESIVVSYSPLYKFGGESGIHQNDFSEMGAASQRKQVWAPEGDFALSAFELTPLSGKSGNITDTLYYNPEGYNNVAVSEGDETLQVVPYPIKNSGRFMIGKNYYDYVALEYMVGTTPTKPPDEYDFPKEYWDELAKKEKRTRTLWAYDENDYDYILQQNNGVTPYRTGRMKLKTKYVFKEKVSVGEESVFYSHDFTTEVLSGGKRPTITKNADSVSQKPFDGTLVVSSERGKQTQFIMETRSMNNAPDQNYIDTFGAVMNIKNKMGHAGLVFSVQSSGDPSFYSFRFDNGSRYIRKGDQNIRVKNFGAYRHSYSTVDGIKKFSVDPLNIIDIAPPKWDEADIYQENSRFEVSWQKLKLNVANEEAAKQNKGDSAKEKDKGGAKEEEKVKNTTTTTGDEEVIVFKVYIKNKLVAMFYETKEDILPNNGRWGVFAKDGARLDVESMYYANKKEGKFITPDNDAGETKFMLEAERALLKEISKGEEKKKKDKKNIREIEKRIEKLKRQLKSRQQHRIRGNLKKYKDAVKSSGGVFEIVEFGSLRAREVADIEARFNNEYPSWGHNVFVTDKDSVEIGVKYITPFGGKLEFLNLTDKIQVLTGGEGQGLFISAKTIFPGEQGKIKKSIGEDIVKKRGTEDVELESKWIQSPESAIRMADWFIDNFYYPGRTIELKTVGNPSIEVGDVIELRGTSNVIIDNSYLFGSIPGGGKYIVTSVSHDMNNDFTTSIVAYWIGRREKYSVIDNSVLRESANNFNIKKDRILV